ncbi:MAG: hypothetical protein ABSG88_16690 [Bradyrhizobium sp.]
MLNLLKADDVEGCESHQHCEQHDGSHVLDHTGLVVARLPYRFLISRKIDQLIEVTLGIFYGASSVYISTVTQPELQYLAAVVRTFWSIGPHGMTTPEHRFLF